MLGWWLVPKTEKMQTIEQARCPGTCSGTGIRWNGEPCETCEGRGTLIVEAPPNELELELERLLALHS